MKKIISLILSAAMLTASLPVFAEENIVKEVELPWEEEEIGTGEIAEPAEINYPDVEEAEAQEVPEYEPIVHTEEISKDIELPEEEYTLFPDSVPGPEDANMFSAIASDDFNWSNLYAGRYGEDYFQPYMRNGDGERVTGDTNRLVIEETDLTLPGKNGLDLVIKRKYDNQGSRRVLNISGGPGNLYDLYNWYYVYTFRNTSTNDFVKIAFPTAELMYKYAYSDGFNADLLEPIEGSGSSVDINNEYFYYFFNKNNPKGKYHYELEKDIQCEQVIVKGEMRSQYKFISHLQFQSRDYLGKNWSFVIPEASAIVYDSNINEHYSNTVYRCFLTGTFRDIYGGVHSFKGDETYTKYDDSNKQNTYVSSYRSDASGDDLQYESIFDPSVPGKEYTINGRYYNFKVCDDRGLTYYLWDKQIGNGLEKPSELRSRQMYVIAVEDDYGNTIEYFYDDSYTKLEKIIDTYGREIKIEETENGSRISYYDDQEGKTKYITYEFETLPSSSLDNDSIVEPEPVSRFTVTNEEGEKTIYDSREAETVSYVDRDYTYGVNDMPTHTENNMEVVSYNNIERIIYPNGDEKRYHYNDIYRVNSAYDLRNGVYREGMYAVDSEYEIIDGVEKYNKQYSFSNKDDNDERYDILVTSTIPYLQREVVTSFGNSGRKSMETITPTGEEEPYTKKSYSYNGLGNPVSVTVNENGYVRTQRYEYVSNHNSVLKSESNGLYKTEYSYHTRTDGDRTVITDKPSIISYMQNTGDDKYEEVYRVETDLTADGREIARERTIQDGKIVAQKEYDYDSEGNIVETRQWTNDENGDGVLNEADDPITVTNDHEITAQKTKNITTVSDDIINADGVSEGNVSFAYKYNMYGLPISQTDPYGVETAVEYDDTGRPVKFDLPNGGTQQLTYDMEEGCTYATDASGSTMKYEYDGRGRIQAEYRSNGTSYDKVKEYMYNSRGMLVGVHQYTDGSNYMTESYGYDIFDRLSTKNVFDNGGAAMYRESYSYAASGEDQVVTKTVKDYTSSTTGTLVSTEIDTYDKYGRLIKQEIENGDESIVKEYEYDYADRVTKETDGNGGETLYEYNYAGQVTKQTNALGDSVSTVYDMAGQALTVTDANGNTTSTEYDALGRAVRSVTPFDESTGGEVKTYYDKNSNTVKTAVKRSADLYSTTEYKYDVMGNAVAQIVENGESDLVTQYKYDLAGKVTEMITGLTAYSEDPVGGASTKYEYNSSGYLYKVTDPMGGVETYNEYDRAGNVLSKTDRNSNVIKNVYGVFGLKKSYTEGSPETKEYTYDGLGNVIKTKSVNKNGEEVTEEYSYDGLGRLTESISDEGEKQEYSYDSNSNLTSYKLTGAENSNEISYEYNAANRLTKLTNNGIITTYGYDANGNLLMKDQNNGVNTEYEYNDAGMLTRMETTKGGSVYTYSENEYLLNGSLKSSYMPYKQGSTYESRTKHYNYDNSGRLIHDYTANAASQPVINSYEYDARGNRVKKTTSNYDDHVTETTTYENDLNNRIINESSNTYNEEQNTNKYKDTHYYYDGNGNMTAKQVGIPTTVNIPDEGSSEAIISGHSSRVAGTSIYRYDVFGRLTNYNSGTIAAEYEYNADNMRTQKRVNGTETDFVWNGGNLAEEYGSSNGVYTYDGQGIHISNQDGVVKTYLKDQHMNIVGYADEDGELINTGDYGMDYDAFGNQWTGESPDPFGYSGEYLDDETGLIYLRNRYYDSSTGRFITEDPAKDGTNWYSYCAGDPVNAFDPWGLDPGDVFETADLAAIDWGEYYYSTTQYSQLELSSFIYEVEENGEIIGYSYTKAIIGEPHDGGDMWDGLEQIPEDDNMVAYVHSHPTSYRFSEMDAYIAYELNIAAYLVTPNLVVKGGRAFIDESNEKDNYYIEERIVTMDLQLRGMSLAEQIAVVQLYGSRWNEHLLNCTLGCETILFPTTGQSWEINDVDYANDWAKSVLQERFYIK